MIRSTDPAHLPPSVPSSVGYDPVSLVGDRSNVLLVDGQSAGLFEAEGEGVYSGHYFFRKAKSEDLARKMLSEMFTTYDARLIKGLTPVDNLLALRLTRRLGFTSHGVIETPAGPMEIFTLTKDQL